MVTTSPNLSIRPLTASCPVPGWSVGGMALADLADRFGTPLYVLDGATVGAACDAYREALARHYPGEALAIYASKANCCLAINRYVHERGLGTEVVSGGELYTALSAGVPAEAIFFQGNNKSSEELEQALRAGVGRVMVDNLEELALLGELTETLGAHVDLILRLTPGIEAHTHEFIRTGGIDSKFGIDLSEVETAVALIARAPLLRYRGLQGHVGSQIFETAPFEACARILCELAAHLRTEHGFITEDLDMGGGLGISYVEGDDPPAIEAAVAAIARAVTENVERLGLPMPRLIVEPGRSIVGPAGCTIYTIGASKQVPGGRRYLAVDGGMPDNPRPITYGARYSADSLVPRVGEPQTVAIAGKCCESGDLLIEELVTTPLLRGDRLVVWGTGAYNFSMASNYNRLPRPAMVWVEDGHATLIRARETHADLVALDRLPEGWGTAP